jgi:hypothetical protein
MDELLCEVLDLQRVWQADNTDAMKRRGVVVRTEIRDWLRGQKAALAAAMDVPVEDVGIEGRDGTGKKTEVAWTRVYSTERSPSATEGWYIVYLFSGDGERVYLSLMQGTTVWTGTDFKPRRLADLQRRNEWVRPKLGRETEERRDLQTEIDLRARTPLGRGYEPGNVVAVEYRRDAMPGPDVLREDLLFMARLLGRVYKAADSAPYIPGDMPVEVREATYSAERTAGRRTVRGTGQGFLLTVAERQAIERRSVLLATEYFQAQGWHVEDVGDKRPYDLYLTHGEEKLHVEVKGTTSAGSQVVLTRGEVEAQRNFAPQNALVVVHSIELDRTVQPPKATGGIVHCTSPWAIEDERLSVVSYIYRTEL